MNKIHLTQYSKAAGCGCKIAPSVLEEILRGQQSVPHFPQLLVGSETRDDAAVFSLGNGTALISTTDFFMPVVDDPYDFGRIAAANAISDVYAMGAKPLMALAILGWPVEKIPTEHLARLMEGGRAVCAAAGIPLAGGHSVDAAEPLFVLSVSGIVQEENIKRNNTVKNGDTLYLTKPLGTGIMTTALKRGKLQELHYTALIENMCRLNQVGEELGKLSGVSAMTDVTGFGFIGHLNEMLEGTAYSAEISYKLLPLLPGLNEYVAQFIFPDNTTRNYNAYKSFVSEMEGLQMLVLCDPQTSGGLLISVQEHSRETVEGLLKRHQLYAGPIGKIIPQQEKRMMIQSN